MAHVAVDHAGIHLTLTRGEKLAAHSHQTFAVTRKGAPGLRIILRDNAYHQLVVSVPQAARLVEQITSRLDMATAGSVDERLLASRRRCRPGGHRADARRGHPPPTSPACRGSGSTRG